MAPRSLARREQDSEQRVRGFARCGSSAFASRVVALAGIGQPRPDLRIGEPRARMHDRGIELVRLDRALRRDVHVARHAQAVDVRLERAELVRQLLRQHRDHAAREVHRGAALARLGVERVAVAHVVRDVGDGDDEPEALALALAIDGVVEVLRRLAVDRDERQRRQVVAALAIGRPHLGRQALRLPLRRLRELERQVVLAQRDLDLDARIGRAAQHLVDARDRLAMLGRLLDDLDDDDLAGLCASPMPSGGHQEVLVDAPVLRDDEPDAALLVQPPDDLAIGAREHFDDRALGAAAAIDADARDRRAVAVQHLVHLARAEEEVVAAVVGNRGSRSRRDGPARCPRRGRAWRRCRAGPCDCAGARRRAARARRCRLRARFAARAADARVAGRARRGRAERPRRSARRGCHRAKAAARVASACARFAYRLVLRFDKDGRVF